MASEPASVGCATLSLIRLEVKLAAGSTALRAIDLRQGDTLAFTFRGDKGVTGAVALIAEAGQERELLRGPSGTKGSFTADESGKMGYRLAATGGRQGSFTVTCAPANPEGDLADGLQADAAADLDLSAPLPADGKPAPRKNETTAAAPAVPAPAQSLEWVGGQKAETQTGDTLGVKLKLQPAILVGFQAQFTPDGSDPLLGPGALSDRSWLAGPITSVQLVPGLSLDARAAWGPTDPGLSAIGHAGDRQVLDARLASKQTFGPWRFSPSAGVTYLQEKAGGAVALEQTGVPDQTVQSGRVDVKPEMAYRIDMGQSVFIEPKIMVGAFWDLGGAAGPGADAQFQKELRHMAETGIVFGTEDGSKLQLGGRVEEGEALAEDVWSGRVQVNIPLK